MRNLPIGLGTEEEVVSKEAVPGELGDYADGHAILGMGADVEVLDEEFPSLQVAEDLPMEVIEGFRLKGLIDRTPPDLALGGRLSNDESVLWGAACVLSGAHNERPTLSNPPFAPLDDLLIERRYR
jgi:hypothetical protein